VRRAERGPRPSYTHFFHGTRTAVFAYENPHLCSSFLIFNLHFWFSSNRAGALGESLALGGPGGGGGGDSFALLQQRILGGAAGASASAAPGANARASLPGPSPLPTDDSTAVVNAGSVLDTSAVAPSAASSLAGFSPPPRGPGPARDSTPSLSFSHTQHPLADTSANAAAAAGASAAGAAAGAALNPPLAAGESASGGGLNGGGGAPALSPADMSRLVAFYKEQAELLQKDNVYYKDVAR
jgi:hypothetical protein